MVVVPFTRPAALSSPTDSLWAVSGSEFDADRNGLEGTDGQGIQVHIDASEIHAGDNRVGEPPLPRSGAVLPPPRHRVDGEEPRAGDLARDDGARSCWSVPLERACVPICHS